MSTDFPIPPVSRPTAKPNLNRAEAAPSAAARTPATRITDTVAIAPSSVLRLFGDRLVALFMERLPNAPTPFPSAPPNIQISPQNVADRVLNIARRSIEKVDPVERFDSVEHLRAVLDQSLGDANEIAALADHRGERLQSDLADVRTLIESGLENFAAVQTARSNPGAI